MKNRKLTISRTGISASSDCIRIESEDEKSRVITVLKMETEVFARCITGLAACKCVEIYPPEESS